jgi:thioredoxin reductase (NADPH)
MPDYAVVVVGGGPAGLTAALQLAQAGHPTIVLEREMFGGNLQHTARVDDYSAYPDGITGALLAAEMIERATSAGVVLEQADVTALELFSRSRWVACADGRGFSCKVVILAGGTRYQQLGLPNEERLRGRGVIDCTPCDGGFFVGEHVAVYGSSRYAILDAAYLADLGAKVTWLTPDANVQAANTGIDVRGGVQLVGILGEDRVAAIVCTDTATRAQEKLAVRGVAIRTGSVPNTEVVSDVVECAADGRIMVDDDMATSTTYVLACGDIRAGTRGGVAAAVEDSTRAAHAAIRLCEVG